MRGLTARDDLLAAILPWVAVPVLAAGGLTEIRRAVREGRIRPRPIPATAAAAQVVNNVTNDPAYVQGERR